VGEDAQKVSVGENNGWRKRPAAYNQVVLPRRNKEEELKSSRFEREELDEGEKTDKESTRGCTAYRGISWGSLPDEEIRKSLGKWVY